MRLLSVLGASEALADHLCRHPEHWRELTDPTMGSTRPAAYAVREDLLRAVGADPHDPTPSRHRRRTTRPSTRCASSTAGSCSASPPATSTHHLGVDDAAAELSDLAAGTLEAAPGRGPAAGGRDGVRGAAGRDRDGQVRRPRAQLRLRRRRDLRRTSRPTAPTPRRAGRGPPGRQPAGQPPDAGLLRAHHRGHDLAGRRGAAARGERRPADPHPGQPPGLLRAVGEDLGVPGAAQGPRGGR